MPGQSIAIQSYLGGEMGKYSVNRLRASLGKQWLSHFSCVTLNHQQKEAGRFLVAKQANSVMGGSLNIHSSKGDYDAFYFKFPRKNNGNIQEREERQNSMAAKN